MSKPLSPSIQCPLCETKVNKRWATQDFFHCPSCHLVFRKPDTEKLDTLYKIGWCDPAANRKITGGTSQRLGKIYLSKLARCLGRKDLRGLRILDFGAGQGVMMTLLHEAGVEAVGVDPYGCNYLKMKGFTAYPTISDLPPGTAFDGVLIMDVVEHLPNVCSDLASLKEILKRDGWIFITTANSGGFNALVSQEHWREAQNPGHLFLFTPQTLTAVLDECGFSNYRRLYWFIKYGRNPATSIIHWILQLLQVDGEIKYLVHMS